jgi:F-type H+-transporting ATPase subunit delta
MTAPVDPSSAVASIKLDAGARQVGVVYAKALFAAAQKILQLDEVAVDFDAVVQVLQSQSDFFDLSRSGMISPEDRAEIFRKAFGGKVHPLLLSFLRTVARHGRSQYLREIHAAFREMNDERIGQVRVAVSTAARLDDSVGRKITEALQKALGRTPILETKVAPQLIGGAMLRVGDTVYDASVATQLEKIRTQMIDRSVHEIQSRRDRFRLAERN